MSGRENGGFARFMAFVVGGIVGAVGGLILAPRSGKETREQLKSRLEDLAEEGKDKFEDQRTRLRVVAEERGQELKTRIEDARGRLVSEVESISEAVKERIERGAGRAEEAVETVEERAEEQKTEEQADEDKGAI